MEMSKLFLFLSGGLVLLSWGANLFVHSASHLARKLGVSPVIIGLTVVAFGTSAPEMAVNVFASLQGNADIAMGNIVGSNIFNIGFILGVCALIKTLFVSAQLIRIDIPIMVGTAGLLWWMSRDHQITKGEGVALILGIILYVLLQIKLAVKGKNSDRQFSQEFSQTGRPLKDSLILISGLSLLIAGARFFVDGAILGARLLGLSEAVIGLTVIAAGTSLPEVATSVAATLRGERDIAIGNVVGSNIFNILSVIGISSAISSNGLIVNSHMASIDCAVMVALSFLCLPFCIWRKKLDRLLGLGFFLSWAFYTYYLIIKNGQA